MSQIRFHVDNSPITEWEEEHIRHGAGVHTAVARIGDLRQRFPSAAIRIERRGDVRIPNPVKTYRYKIQLEGNEIRYTNLVNESEKDALLKKVTERFPKAEIIEEAF